LTSSWGWSARYPDSEVIIDRGVEATMYFDPATKLFYVFYLDLTRGSRVLGVGCPIVAITFRWNNTANKPVDKASLGDVLTPGTSHPQVNKYGSNFFMYGLKTEDGGRSCDVYTWQTNASQFPYGWTDYGWMIKHDANCSWERWITYRSSLAQDGYGNVVTPNNMFYLFYTGFADPASGGTCPNIGLATAPASP